MICEIPAIGADSYFDLDVVCPELGVARFKDIVRNIVHNITIVN